MDSFLKRISSRKFLTAIAVEIAAMIALFAPQVADVANEGALRIAALATMLLAALGYGAVEAAVDKAKAGEGK